MKKIILTKADKYIEIPFNPEQPFLDVKTVHFKTSEQAKNNSSLAMNSLRVYFQVEYLNAKIDNTQIASFLNLKKDQSVRTKHENYKLENVKKIHVYYTCDTDLTDSSISIEIEYDVINRLDCTFPENEFDEHLKDKRNSKILFSAAFGQGKTTFLENYFDAKKDEYRVFNIFPVNYSVSSNEDIFKYIKFEILLQLLDHPDYFDEIYTDYPQSAENFGLKNLDKILAPLLLAIPKIGGSLYSIFEKYDKLKSEYLKYHDSQQIDDKEEALEFIKQIYDKEGSIYEDNFYTQLIRQILEKLKIDSPAIENVLIIEDLDRLDPDHIFRILNVLSAHFDSINFNQTTETNKFGFDRIILVCDYDNIRHIFEHKFGPKVKFGGYINKFYSKSVFNFDNTKIVEQIINNIDNYRDNHHDLENRSNKYLALILKSLFSSNEISLRDLFKLRKISLNFAVYKLLITSYQTTSTFYLRNSPYTAIFILLERLGNTETVKKHIENLESVHFSNSNIQRMCLELLVPLGREISATSSNIEYVDKTKKILFQLNVGNKQSDGNFEVINHTVLTLNDRSPANYDFTFDEFKVLLIRNLEMYNAIKHLI